MNFNEWLDVFVSEKELDLEEVFEIKGPLWGTNYMPLSCVVEAIKATSSREQKQIKNMIVKIDFVNGDILGYFKHLAQAIAL